MYLGRSILVLTWCRNLGEDLEKNKLQKTIDKCFKKYNLFAIIAYLIVLWKIP